MATRKNKNVPSPDEVIKAPIEENSEKALKEMSVSEYFDYVKGMKKETDSESVKKMIEVCEGFTKEVQPS